MWCAQSDEIAQNDFTWDKFLQVHLKACLIRLPPLQKCAHFTRTRTRKCILLYSTIQYTSCVYSVLVCRSARVPISRSSSSSCALSSRCLCSKSIYSTVHYSRVAACDRLCASPSLSLFLSSECEYANICECLSNRSRRVEYSRAGGGRADGRTGRQAGGRADLLTQCSKIITQEERSVIKLFYRDENRTH